jgi:hypothetical protein
MVITKILQFEFLFLMALVGVFQVLNLWVIVYPIIYIFSKLYNALMDKIYKHKNIPKLYVKYNNNGIEDIKESINQSPWGLYLTNKIWHQSKYIDKVTWGKNNYISIEEIQTTQGRVDILAQVVFVKLMNEDGYQYHELTLEDPSGKVKVNVGLLDPGTEEKLTRRGYYFRITIDVKEEGIFPLHFESI